MLIPLMTILAQVRLAERHQRSVAPEYDFGHTCLEIITCKSQLRHRRSLPVSEVVFSEPSGAAHIGNNGQL